MQIKKIWTEEEKIRMEILASSADTIIYSVIAHECVFWDIMKLNMKEGLIININMNNRLNQRHARLLEHTLFLTQLQEMQFTPSHIHLCITHCFQVKNCTPTP